MAVVSRLTNHESVRIVQLANFYGPRSGGLRTALNQLGAGYRERGHEVVLIVPGDRRAEETLPSGVTRITLPAPRLPYTAGYRAADPRRVADVLAALRPDAIEVSDRLTLRGFGRWARRRDVASVMISHERLDRLLGQMLPGPVARRLADVANRHSAADYDTIVCTTDFARREFLRIDAPNVSLVPLGVDLDLFAPHRRDSLLRSRLAGSDLLLVHCGRLSVEKRVDRSIGAVAALTRAGVRVRLVVAGDGPRRASLQRRAAGCRCTSRGSFTTARGWPPCSRPRTSRSHPARTRHSGSPRSSRSPPAPRSWRADRPRSPTSSPSTVARSHSTPPRHSRGRSRKWRRGRCRSGAGPPGSGPNNSAGPCRCRACSARWARSRARFPREICAPASDISPADARIARGRAKETRVPHREGLSGVPCGEQPGAERDRTCRDRNLE